MSPVQQQQQQHPAVTIHSIVQTKQSVVMHHQSQSNHAALQQLLSGCRQQILRRHTAVVCSLSTLPAPEDIYLSRRPVCVFRAKGHVTRAGFRRRFLALSVTHGQGIAMKLHTTCSQCCRTIVYTPPHDRTSNGTSK